jgi:hypothetical protein
MNLPRVSSRAHVDIFFSFLFSFLFPRPPYCIMLHSDTISLIPDGSFFALISPTMFSNALPLVVLLACVGIHMQTYLATSLPMPPLRHSEDRQGPLTRP